MESNIVSYDRQRFQINSKVIIKQLSQDSDKKETHINCQYLINLCLLNDNLLERENIGKLLALLSYIVFENNGYLFHMYITTKVNQIYLKNNFFEIYTLVRVNYRMGELFLKRNNLIHAYSFLLKAKKHSQLITLKEEASKILNEAWNKCNLEMIINIQSKDNYYFTDKDLILNSLKELENLFTRIERKNVILSNQGDRVYLISVKWMTNLIAFLNKYASCSDHNVLKEFLSIAFNLDNVTNNYFRENNIEPNGCYPYQINNYDLIDFQDHWNDQLPKKKYENAILRKNMIEGVDYYCINKTEWNILKKQFNATNKIVRYRSNSQLNQYIIYLREIEIFILEPTLKTDKKHLINIRKIQFSEQTTIYELIEKIKRCLQLTQANLLYHFYSIPLKEKNCLVNISIAYTLNCPKYQVSFNKFNITNDDLAINLCSLNYDNEKQIIILELVHNEYDSFLTLETAICSKCSKSISSSPVRCPHCYYNYFCSKKCLDLDENHMSVHDFIYWIPQFDSLKNIPLRKYIKESNNNGRTGLKNIGLSCYMNSAIQCLSNTEELTKYFLSKTYEKEINSFNDLGTHGKFSKIYEDLIFNLWNTQNYCFIPYNLIDVINKNNRDFQRYTMQDVQEFLIYFLDQLHEDLNRINTKPYFDMSSQQSSETDDEASLRWWNCHRKREDSIIVDLFHGQYKLTIQCPNCKYKNITYDPFLFLSLPIPIESTYYEFRFIRANHVCYKKSMLFNKNITFFQVCEHIALMHDIKAESIEGLVFEKNKTVFEILTQNIPINSLINDEKEIVFYEKELDNNHRMIYVYPIEISTNFFTLFNITPKISYLSYPLRISVNINSTIENLCVLIYQSISHILYDKSLIDIQEILKNNQTSSLPFKIHFAHKIGSTMFIKTFKCNFCKDTNSLCCNILKQFSLSTSLKHIIFNQSNQLPLIYVEIPSYDKSKQLYNAMTIPLDSNYQLSPIKRNNDNFSINECIKLFTAKEKLSKDNKWYCSVCKNHQEAIQKSDIYRTPNYLIIHLKRFAVTSEVQMVTNQKNNSFVKYPIEGLNLNNYVLGNNGENELYDLYGVVNHYGTLDKGHYIALCKNSNQWIQYNDEEVSLSTNNNVINSNAYLLFYKKRSLNYDY